MPINPKIFDINTSLFFKPKKYVFKSTYICVFSILCTTSDVKFILEFTFVSRVMYKNAQRLHRNLII